MSLLLRKHACLDIFPRWYGCDARRLANPVHLDIRHSLWRNVGDGGRSALAPGPRARRLLPRARRSLLLARAWRPLLLGRVCPWLRQCCLYRRLPSFSNCFGLFSVSALRGRKLRDLQVSRASDLVYSKRSGPQLAISPAVSTAGQESGRCLPFGASTVSLAGTARDRGLLASSRVPVRPCDISVDCVVAAREFSLRKRFRTGAGKFAIEQSSAREQCRSLLVVRPVASALPRRNMPIRRKCFDVFGNDVEACLTLCTAREFQRRSSLFIQTH